MNVEPASITPDTRPCSPGRPLMTPAYHATAPHTPAFPPRHQHRALHTPTNLPSQPSFALNTSALAPDTLTLAPPARRRRLPLVPMRPGHPPLRRAHSPLHGPVPPLRQSIPPPRRDRSPSRPLILRLRRGIGMNARPLRPDAAEPGKHACHRDGNTSSSCAFHLDHGRRGSRPYRSRPLKPGPKPIAPLHRPSTFGLNRTYASRTVLPACPRGR